jgi:dTMP kinase
MNVWVNNLKTYSGHLIVFEGIDGSGKSICIQNLFKKLSIACFDVVNFAEPSNGIFGTQIREAASSGGKLPDPQIVADLFVKDRIENRDKNLLPALREDKIVLLDRYFYSNIAYQGVDLSPEYIFELNKNVILNPDLTFLFDIDVDTALTRIIKNRAKTTSFEKKEFLEKVKTIYNSLESSIIRRIDAHRNLTEVCKEIYAIIINFLVATKKGQAIECIGKTLDSGVNRMSI